MDEVSRFLRRLAIVALPVTALIALPAQALACGIGLGFGETIRQSSIVVLATSEGQAHGKDVFMVDRVLKGWTSGYVSVTVSEVPVRARAGDRLALAIMHPQYDDGNGVSAWLIHRDGSLSSMGQDGEPRTVDSFVNYFMAPTTSTDSVAIGGAPVPGGLPVGLPVVAAGLLGGCLFWRRVDARGLQVEKT